MSDTTDSISDAANAACNSLYPTKSKERYLHAYEQFQQWRLGNNVEQIDEKVIMAYFFEKSKVMKSSTLWSQYSMLKATFKIKENINLENYKMLNAFLKRQKENYQRKQSFVFTTDNVIQFLNNAKQETYLLIKVVLIFGLNGACRCAELYNLTINDINDMGNILIVNLHDTKTRKNRRFTITNDCRGYDLYQQYAKLRPGNVQHNSLFVYYYNGKCTTQRVGIHTFGKISQKIAEFLKLPEPQKYTGHCLRRTSTTFLADSGVDIQILKRHGGWKSNSAPETYIDDSINNKINTSKHIFQQICQPSTTEKPEDTAHAMISETNIPPSDSTLEIIKSQINIAPSASTSHAETNILSSNSTLHAVTSQIHISASQLSSNVITSNKNIVSSNSTSHTVTSETNIFSSQFSSNIKTSKTDSEKHSLPINIGNIQNCTFIINYGKQ